jgi:hypothetical protein
VEVETEGAVALRDRLTRSTSSVGWSDCQCEFVEGSRDSQRWRRVESEFVVAAAQILHEGVPGDNNLGGPIGSESAHRSEPMSIARYT